MCKFGIFVNRIFATYIDATRYFPDGEPVARIIIESHITKTSLGSVILTRN
jgi:hypothetical protein